MATTRTRRPKADTRPLKVYADHVDHVGTVLCPRHRDHVFRRNPAAFGAGEYGGECEICKNA